MTQPRLTYFDISGNRGEEIRLTLALAGVEFEDVRIAGKAWAAKKPQTPTASLPILEMDGATLTHTNAILRLLGRRHGLHPSDDVRAARHEGLMGYAEDLRQRIGGTISMAPDAKKAAREALAANFIPAWAANSNALLEGLGEGPFADGDAIQVVDVKLFMMVRWLRSGMIDHVPADLLDGHTRLLGVHAAVAAHPVAVARYG